MTAAELAKFLAERVARRQLPERWAFVAEIPKTSVGESGEKTLRRRCAEGGVDIVRVD